MRASASGSKNALKSRTTDYPEKYAPGNHVSLDTGPVVTVRWDQ